MCEYEGRMKCFKHQKVVNCHFYFIQTQMLGYIHHTNIWTEMSTRVSGMQCWWLYQLPLMQFVCSTKIIIIYQLVTTLHTNNQLAFGYRNNGGLIPVAWTLSGALYALHGDFLLHMHTLCVVLIWWKRLCLCHVQISYYRWVAQQW